MTNIPHNLTISPEIPLYKGVSASEVSPFNLTLTSLYPHFTLTPSVTGASRAACLSVRLKVRLIVRLKLRLIVRLKVRFAVRLENIGNSLCKAFLRDFSEVKTRLRLVPDDITARL